MDFSSTSVEVDVLSFATIFQDAAFPLALDTYQRGFVWGETRFGSWRTTFALISRIPTLKHPTIWAQS